MRVRSLLGAAAAALLVLGLSMPASAEAAKKSQPKQETKQEQKADTSKKEPSAAQKAARERMKECGAEWQGMKKKGQTKNTTWRKFSSECLKKKG